MHLPGHEFLAGAALAQDQDGRVGRGDQVDLTGDRFQGGPWPTISPNAPAPVTSSRRYSFSSSTFSSAPRSVERSGGGDGGGSVVGDPQPTHALRPDGPAGEHASTPSTSPR